MYKIYNTNHNVKYIHEIPGASLSSIKSDDYEEPVVVYVPKIFLNYPYVMPLPIEYYGSLDEYPEREQYLFDIKKDLFLNSIDYFYSSGLIVLGFTEDLVGDLRQIPIFSFSNEDDAIEFKLTYY